MLRAVLCVVTGLLLSGCVHQGDLDAWVGRPVIDLELHPFFLTVPVIKTVASDGTEIWNYVNGASISSCRGNLSGSTSKSVYVDFANYSSFMACSESFPACNNIFYIKNNVVLRYVPVGTSGASCITNKTLRPQFRGPTNY